jgi:hypothetical protein
LIEHREVVPGLEQPARHALSHAAEADESDFHVGPQIEDALIVKAAEDFDARPSALQAGRGRLASTE